MQKPETLNNMNKTYAQELLEKERFFFKRKISYAKKHKENLENMYKDITSAKSYKFWQKANKVKRDFALLMNFHTVTITTQFIKDYLLGRSKSSSLTRRSIELSHHEKKYIELLPEIKKTEHFDDVTIIIPTYNGEEELPRLFKAIQTQNRITKPEIIIIDSESKDNTVAIAKEHGATVLTVKQKEFNHGTTRNLAAKHAKGKYIIFTVQDEIPANRDTFADLLTLLTHSPLVVAASTRQIPFPDADLFAKWQILNHLSALQLNDVNFIISYEETAEFVQQPFLVKRKLALLDDVCCAVKKKEFQAIGGYRKIDFAEDVDLAIRALSSGYCLGFLGTNGVIHSHTRPTPYFLNRSFADVQSLHTMFQEAVPSMFSSFDELMNVARNLYAAKLASGKHDEFLNYLDEIIKTLGLKKYKNGEVVQGEEVYWELYNNILNQALSLFPAGEVTTENKPEFSQKLFSSLIGSQIGLYFLDTNTTKDDKFTNRVQDLLLKHV